MITKYFGIVLFLYKLQFKSRKFKTKRPEARPNFNCFQIDTLIYMATKIFVMKQLMKDLDFRSKTFRVGLKLNGLVSWL